MATVNRWRTGPAGIALSLLLTALVSAAENTHVSFDLPQRIECRDVSPPDYAASHPTTKVIEARFRITARLMAGSESDIVDFLYIIAGSNRNLQIQDYLPNTTLESTVAGDQIEITDQTETAGNITADSHVGYKILSLGVSQTKGTKETESSHYKQIAPKALVLASGTTDREHGVFFKLRPSKQASLEGAKEFTFLATVPRNWRGDWCTISCAARANSRFFLTKSVAPAGVEQVQVGMYLVGNPEAARLVDHLRDVQDAYANVLKTQLDSNSESLLDTMYAAVVPQALSSYTASLCGLFKCRGEAAARKPPSERTALEEAQKAVLDVQARLRSLAE